MKHFENILFVLMFIGLLTADVWMIKIHQVTHWTPSMLEALSLSATLGGLMLIGNLLWERYKNRQPKSYYHKVVR